MRLSRPEIILSREKRAGSPFRASLELTQVVQRAHDQIKPLDPLDVILRLLDISMPRVDIHPSSRIEMNRGRGGYERFGFLDVVFAKEELSVEV